MNDKRAHFERYRDSRGDWRWRLVAGNGEIIANGEGYASKFNVTRSIHTFVDTIRAMDLSALDVIEVDA